MVIEDLHDKFVYELQEMYYIENQSSTSSIDWPRTSSTTISDRVSNATGNRHKPTLLA